MPRTILVHLNIELADDSPLQTEDVEKIIDGALDVGLSDPPPESSGLGPVVIALAEEI